MPDKQLFANNATTTLNGAITNVATTIIVDDASVFPTLLAPSAGLQSEFTLVTIENEIIKVTAISGNTMTVVRAQEGTTGAAHDDGKDVEAFNTAGSLESFLAVDPDGDRKGENSVNIQPARSASTQVASGDTAIAIGENTTASGDFSISAGRSATASGDYAIAMGDGASATTASAVAIGRGAEASLGANVAIGYFALAETDATTTIGDYARSNDLANVTAWSASEEVVGTIVREIDGNWGVTTGSFDLTGGTEPTGDVLGDWVTDNAVTWYIFEDTAANDDSSTCVGDATEITGGDSIAVGTGAKAYGNGNGVLGFNNSAAGQDNVLVGTGSTSYGRGNTLLGVHGRSYNINDREVTNSTVIGNDVKFSVSYSCRTVGADYLPLEDGLYAGGHTVDEHYTASASEETFFSPPICAGVNAWTASTSYTHGETVTVLTGAPTNFSYFARIVGSNGHYGAATSGGIEPTWPTTPGGTVADGSITWVCVNRTDIRCYLPDNVRLLPTQVGFVADQFATSVTTTPTISYGVVGGLADWKTSVQATNVSGPYTRHESQIGGDGKIGSNELGADVTTFGDGMTSGRVYWKGIVVETLET